MLHRTINALMIMTIAFTMSAAHGQVMDILFLSKSSGFEHGVIQRHNDEPSHVENVLSDLARNYGARINNTKDASYITAENLENYDVVIFYTSGDLLTEGTDGHPPMTEEGKDSLLEWIENGGGFIGYHSASDTFRVGEDGEPGPFVEMLGAEFAWHGPNFTGTVRVTDPAHPTVTRIPEEWEVYDEWYVFRHFNRDNMRVLAVLDPPEDVREEHEGYDIAELPVIWVSSYGDGRVYYNAMGHVPELWEDSTFQEGIVDAVTWANGQGPARTTPNYYDVIDVERPEEE